MDTRNGRQVTGDDLRLYRVAARLTMRQVSECYGASPQRIATIEAHSRPTNDAVTRYVRAVQAAEANR